MADATFYWEQNCQSCAGTGTIRRDEDGELLDEPYTCLACRGSGQETAFGPRPPWDTLTPLSEVYTYVDGKKVVVAPDTTKKSRWAPSY